MHELVAMVADGIEAVAVVVIVGGIVYGIARCFIGRATEPGRAYRNLKFRLGASLLLGLEFLVAGDIIRTVALNPTLDKVATLGVLIAVRTFLSWALVVEMDGRWPWRAKTESEGR